MACTYVCGLREEAEVAALCCTRCIIYSVFQACTVMLIQMQAWKCSALFKTQGKVSQAPMPYCIRLHRLLY